MHWCPPGQVATSPAVHALCYSEPGSILEAEEHHYEHHGGPHNQEGMLDFFLLKTLLLFPAMLRSRVHSAARIAGVIYAQMIF